MSVLVVCCFLIGLVPILIAPIFGQAAAAWDPGLNDAGARLRALAPLDWITIVGLLLIAVLSAGSVVLWLLLRRRAAATGITWACGYVAPTPRMQYTASSFAQMLVGLFQWALRPRTRRSMDLGLFPRQAAFHSDVPDPVLDDMVLPAFRFWGWLCSWFRVLQQGSIQTYLMYVFAAVIVLLLWR